MKVIYNIAWSCVSYGAPSPFTPRRDLGEPRSTSFTRYLGTSIINAVPL